jgi:hypothetical protein
MELDENLLKCKLKQLLDQRAAQQFRLDTLIDDYACGLLDRAELARAKTKAQGELSRINGKIESLNACGTREGYIQLGSRSGKFGRRTRATVGVAR